MASLVILLCIKSDPKLRMIINGKEGGGTVDICIALQVGLHSHTSLIKTSNWDHLSTSVKLFYHSQSIKSLLLGS